MGHRRTRRGRCNACLKGFTGSQVVVYDRDVDEDYHLTCRRKINAARRAARGP